MSNETKSYYLPINLDDLQAQLNHGVYQRFGDMSDMPIFGGEPIDEVGVFSWDETRVLRQTEYGWEIEDR